MVKLNANTWGFEFEQGVRVIMTAYRHADAAMAKNLDDLATELQQYRAACERGEVVFDDEDYDRDVYIEHEQTETIWAQQIVRQSTLTMLFHYWEKQVCRWAEFEGAGQLKSFKEQLAYISQKLGMHPDLKLLHQIVLLIKHDDHDPAENLWRANKICRDYNRWEMFNQSTLVGPTTKLNKPYDYLTLSDGVVREFEAVVLASGPSFGSTDFSLKKADLKTGGLQN